jgi:drug/metabolite transporter (DMT)-like permease
MTPLLPTKPANPVTTYILIGMTVMMIVSGQLLLKAGATSLGPLPGEVRSGFSFMFAALTTPAIFFGLVFAFAAALSWIAVLSRAELSFAYPFMILPVVLVLALSPLLFGEEVSALRWAGVLVVFIGLLIAAKG